MTTPVFHRLTVPSYFGGLPSDYDYINNAVSGTPAPANGVIPSGLNAGSYFTAFQEPAASANVNRGNLALAQNTDLIDNLMHTDLGNFTGSAVFTAGGGGDTTRLITPGPCFMGSGGSSVSVLFVVYDLNNNPLMVNGNPVVVNAAVDQGIPPTSVGDGMSTGAVLLTFNITIPATTQYYIGYGKRTNLASLAGDELLRSALDFPGALQKIQTILFNLHGNGEAWNSAWDTTIYGLEQLTTVTGVDVLAQIANIPALRAVASAGLVSNQIAMVVGCGLFAWNSTSALADDGVNVIKPTDTEPSSLGAWLSTRYTPVQSNTASSMGATNWPVVGTDMGSYATACVCWDGAYSRWLACVLNGTVGHSTIQVPVASHDGGLTWQPVSSPTQASADCSPIDICVRSTDGMTVMYIGNGPSGPAGGGGIGYVAAGGGSATWTYYLGNSSYPRHWGGQMMCMESGAHAGRFIAAGFTGAQYSSTTGGEVWYSDDGITWTKYTGSAVSGIPNWTGETGINMSVYRAQTSTSMMFVQSGALLGSVPPVFICTTDGVTFTDVTPPGFSNYFINGLAADTSSPNPAFFVGALNQTSGATEVWVTRNNGVTWTMAHSLGFVGIGNQGVGCNGSTWVMLVGPGQEQGYASSWQQPSIYSQDQGASWRYCNLPLQFGSTSFGAYNSVVSSGTQFLAYNGDHYAASLSVGQSAVSF